VARLNKIIAETGAVVVVSSEWRCGRSCSELQELLDSNGFEGKVVGKTGHGHDGERGRQIMAWLRETGNERAAYVVIDDEMGDMDAVGDHLVKTVSFEGLMDEQVAEAIDKLGVRS